MAGFSTSPERSGLSRPSQINSRHLLLSAFLLAIITGSLHGAEPALSSAPQTLDTPRSFPAISSRKEWQQRAEQIREQVLVSCGLWPMPERTPLNSRVFGRTEGDGFTVEKVAFQSLPGFYVCGNLYRPVAKGAGPFPAVLNPHGHWAQGRLVDNGDASIRARCINFARQGMIAFSYDMLGYNDTTFPGQPANYDFHHLFAADKTNLLWNLTPMGVQTWDSIRALDFLETLPEVDRHRLACTGESGGGTQTFMLGAVDSRLAAQIPAVMVSHIMQGGCVCENAPGLRVDYSNMEIAASAAPRPQMLVAATGDWTKDTPRVEGPAIEAIYQLFNAADRFHYVQFNFGHNYNQTSRQAVYEWLDHRFLAHPDPALVKESPYEKMPDESLRVWPDGKLPDDALTADQLVHNIVARAQDQLVHLWPTNRHGLKAARKILLPLWEHTLLVNLNPASLGQIETVNPPSTTGDAGAIARFTLPEPDDRESLSLEYHPAGTARRGDVVVIADSAGGDEVAREVAGFVAHGFAVVFLPGLGSGKAPEQFAHYYSVYNRTKAQRCVRGLVHTCIFAREVLGARRVLLCGNGTAGLWALLAAPAADAVIADCAQLKSDDDSALLSEDFFVPGLRRLGGFEMVAALATPHPLLLHNVAPEFATENLQRCYRADGRASELRIEPQPLALHQLLEWAGRVR